MRKLLLTTAAVAAAIAGAVAGEPEYGTFTDERDGKVYRTAKIDNQTWMAWNLNYKTPRGSWCYNNALEYCKKYGRLYDWNAAMKACPAGYHLPSRVEWDSLGQAVGGKREFIEVSEEDYWDKRGDVVFWHGAGKTLKVKSGWFVGKEVDGNGTNDFGFSALPGSYRNSAGSFYGAGIYGFWWTATEGDSDGAYYRFMRYDYDLVGEHNYNKSSGFSVRCVADRP